MTTRSTIQGALDAFSALNRILEFELEVEKSPRGAKLEFLGATVHSVVFDNVRPANLSLPAARGQKLTGGSSKTL